MHGWVRPNLPHYLGNKCLQSAGHTDAPLTPCCHFVQRDLVIVFKSQLLDSLYSHRDIPEIPENKWGQMHGEVISLLKIQMLRGYECEC